MPELEERQAARHGGYTWGQWAALPRRERVDAVAGFRLERLIDLHANDAIRGDSRRRARTQEQRSRARNGRR